MQLTDNIEPLRWTDAEFLWWLSDGQRQAATIRPDIFSKVAVVALVAGTRQLLPADGVSLLGVNRNMGTAGTTPRRAVTLIKRDLIDAFRPTWHAATRTLDIKNYLYDPLDPLAYQVYPPSNAAGRVEINYLYSPAMITTVGQNLEIPDAYAPALMDYVLFRAHQKDAESAAGAQTAKMYFETFVQAMTASLSAKTDVNPNNAMAGFKPEPMAQSR